MSKSNEEVNVWIERNNLPLFQLKNLYFECIYDFRRYIEGRILTIVDASIADLEQRKALKDIIREAIRSDEYHTKKFIHILVDFDSKIKLDTFKTEESLNQFLGDMKDHPRPENHYFKK